MVAPLFSKIVKGNSILLELLAGASDVLGQILVECMLEFQPCDHSLIQVVLEIVCQVAYDYYIIKMKYVIIMHKRSLT